MARSVGLLCAAALAGAAADSFGAATCADEEDAASGTGQVTLLQMGRNLSASSPKVELNSSDLTRQPLAGPDIENATTAPEATRRNLLTQMYKRNGGAVWTSAWTSGGEKPNVVFGNMYRRGGANASGRGAQSLVELEADSGNRVKNMIQRAANNSTDWDWNPQVLTVVNIAVVLIVVGGAIGGAVSFLATTEAPAAPSQRHERMTESLFVQQSFERRNRAEDEPAGFPERRGGNDPCC